MITVELDDGLRKYAGGQVEIQLPHGSLPAVLAQLCNTYPQLYVHLLSGTFCTLILNDQQILEVDDLSTLVLAPDDHLCLLETPAGQDPGTVGAWAINLFTTAETAIAVTSWMAITVGSIIIVAGMLAMNVLMGALADDMKMPDLYSGSLDNSATYTFTGIQNTTAAGTPVQIIYGQHRTGGHIVSLFTASEDTNTVAALDAVSISTDTHLYMQLAVSEGEVAAISDIEINKLPQYYYNAITTAPTAGYYALGTSTQTAMLDFSKISNTTSVGRKVTTLTSGNLSNFNVVYSDYQPLLGAIEVDNGVPSKEDLKLGRYVAVSKVTWS